MVGQGYDAAGVAIVGTPPVSRGVFGMLKGFRSQLDLLLAAKARLRPREIERFSDICLGSAANPQFRTMMARTDPRARPILSRAMMAGAGHDQRRIVEQSLVPIAVINGAAEPFARLDYVASLNYGNLWSGQCHVIEGIGHAPFIEAPELFDPIFQLFIDDIATGRAALADAAVDIQQPA